MWVLIWLKIGLEFFSLTQKEHISVSPSVSVYMCVRVFVSDCINSSIVKVGIAESGEEEWQETFNQH